MRTRVVVLASIQDSGLLRAQLGGYTWGGLLGGSTSTLGGTTYSTWGGFGVGLGGISTPTINKDPIVDDDELPKDWEIVNTVGASAELNTECNTCSSPSPSPTSKSLSSAAKPGGLPARVLGERVAVVNPGVDPSICIRGKQGSPRRAYFPRIRKNSKKTPVNGDSAVNIIRTICGKNDRIPDGCPSDALACAWWSVGNRGFVDDFTVNLNGVVDKDANDIWRFTPGFVFPQCLNSQQSVAVPAVYPVAPPGEQIVPVDFYMGLWKLSDEDVRKLKAVDPKLLAFALDVLSGSYQHELHHWKIYEDFLPVYFSVINSPSIPISQASRSAARRAIGNLFNVRWEARKIDEDKKHGDFHNLIGNNKIYQIPPGEDFKHILCRMN